MIEINAFCLCDHSKDQHINSAKACYGCLRDYIKGSPRQICINFKLDNLRYLEQIYNDKVNNNETI